MNAYFLFVVTSILVGAACAWFAYLTKRDPLRWFLYGTILNVLVLALLVVGDKRRNANATRCRS